MNEPSIRHLGVADVVALHGFIMDKLGWAVAPLRDEGLLESAVMRARMAYHYEGTDIVRQATLLAIGISQAQAFIDGNKRAAYICTETFLDINGHEFTGVPLELAQQLEEVASRDDSLDAATDRFEGWLRERVTLR